MGKVMHCLNRKLGYESVLNKKVGFDVKRLKMFGQLGKK